MKSSGATHTEDNEEILANFVLNDTENIKVDEKVVWNYGQEISDAIKGSEFF